MQLHTLNLNTELLAVAALAVLVTAVYSVLIQQFIIATAY
jgi:hypothetical protein